MRHRNPTGDYAVIFEAALDLLLEKLETDRLGKTSRPEPAPSTLDGTLSSSVRPGPNGALDLDLGLDVALEAKVTRDPTSTARGGRSRRRTMLPS